MKRELRPTTSAKNMRWSMDFVADQLYDRHRIQVLVIVDNHTRESLALRVGQRIWEMDVVEVLERISRQHGRPQVIQVDNDPEFISKDLDRWAYWNKVRLNFNCPGKPTDNAPVEAFNSRFRQECLNEHWFMSLEDAKQKIEAWRLEYNGEQPHSALGNLSPDEFVAQSKADAA